MDDNPPPNKKRKYTRTDIPRKEKAKVLQFLMDNPKHSAARIKDEF